MIGNSGSGKSFAGSRLAHDLRLPCLHMDEIFFKPGGFSDERPLPDVMDDLDSVRLSDRWVIEGIFGDLAERCLPNATHLVFLDLGWEECEKGLRSRGYEPEKWNDPELGRRNFEPVISWAKGYWDRSDRFSHDYHLRLHDSFGSVKWRLRTRPEVNEWLKQRTPPVVPSVPEDVAKVTECAPKCAPNVVVTGDNDTPRPTNVVEWTPVEIPLTHRQQLFKDSLDSRGFTEESDEYADPFGYLFEP